jgi:hypothetical protein
MYGQVQYNCALYQVEAQPGHRYRQIAVVEREQFELYVYEGEVLQTEPWSSSSDTGYVRFYPTVKAALEEAERERDQSLKDGWKLYSPIP